MSQWIDGVALSKEIQNEVSAEALKVQRAGIHPRLAVVIVGENPASHIYVRNKVKTCQALGMYSEKIELPNTSSTAEILDVVLSLNRRNDIHGILIQVP